MNAQTGTEPNPYVGLRSFRSEDAWRYFGRNAAIAQLLEILHSNRLLPVIGSSGSGKSSLVFAGLIPRLQAGFLVADRSHWRVATMRPGDRPLERLLEAFLAALPPSTSPDDSVARLADAARAGYVEAVLAQADRLPATDSLLIFADQFEEIFAYRGPDVPADASADVRRGTASRRADATAFVDVLLAIAGSRAQPVFVALTMRSDFLGECDVFAGLPEAMNSGRFLVPRMTRAELRSAIQLPARGSGHEVAPRLLDTLCNELGDRFDRLPLLQHALQRTWIEWQRDGEPYEVDLAHYQASEMIDGALNRDAEMALREVGPPGSAPMVLATRVLRALTDTDVRGRLVRRPLRLSALSTICAAEPEEIRSVLRPFIAEPRCLVTMSGEADPRIEITHESLIRMWQRLTALAGEEARARTVFRDLVKDADAYANGESGLWRPPKLGIGESWAREVKPTEAWAGDAGALSRALRFLGESSAAHRSRRARSVAGVVLATVAVLLGAVTYAVLQQRIADQQRQIVSERDGSIKRLEGIVSALRKDSLDADRSITAANGASLTVKREVDSLDRIVAIAAVRHDVLAAAVKQLNDSVQVLTLKVQRAQSDNVATAQRIEDAKTLSFERRSHASALTDLLRELESHSATMRLALAPRRAVVEALEATEDSLEEAVREAERTWKCRGTPALFGVGNPVDADSAIAESARNFPAYPSSLPVRIATLTSARPVMRARIASLAGDKSTLMVKKGRLMERQARLQADEFHLRLERDRAETAASWLRDQLNALGARGVELARTLSAERTNLDSIDARAWKVTREMKLASESVQDALTQARRLDTQAVELRESIATLNGRLRRIRRDGQWWRFWAKCQRP